MLTEDATKTVMQSLVMSRLDYCNALLIGIQQDLIAKLQRLQNSAARIVSRTRKYEHITPVLIKLHWLPIKFRIQFKVLLLVYKALNGLAPKYIKELLVPYKPRRHLRSEAKGLLDEPRTRLKFGDRAFSISAPRLWNTLPQHLKDSSSCQPIEALLTMTQTMTMCSAFEHFMNHSFSLKWSNWGENLVTGFTFANLNETYFFRN